jgi:predicted lipoprotein
MTITRSLTTALVPAFLFLSSCGSNEDNNPTVQETPHDYTGVITQFINGTVMPTYTSLKDNAIVLYSLVEQLETARTQLLLDSACRQWKATRVPWEQSEGFLFGPAEFRNLDPLLDSWPLDENQIGQVLVSQVELTSDYVREGLGFVLRGFHTAEFLLFKNGAPRKIEDFTEREFDYLIAVTQVLRDDAVTLWAMWNGSEGIGVTEAFILEALDVNAGTGYAQEFLNAGKAGSRYLSQNSALSEMIEGCLGIADEVGNMKIAEPYNSKDPLRVESQFSYNSLDDFCDNIESIRNVVFGGITTHRKVDSSLIALANETNPTLATELDKALTDATTAIRAIPSPFSSNLDKSAAIESAITAVNALADKMEKLHAAISD